MAKKVIISERQLSLLTNHIVESSVHQSHVESIVDDLNKNYEPSKGTYKKGGEYFEEPMVLNKVDKELITLKALLDYMLYKYELGRDFVKQVITDWYTGDIGDSYTLTKNVTIN